MHQRAKFFIGFFGHLFFALNIFGGISLAAKDVPVTNIQVVLGDPVYMPCDISTSEHIGDRVLLVLWYREDLGTPIYSVDGRDRDFSLAERWSDENVFGNRAYFMSEKTPAELGVDHVRDTDQGVYRCRVDFKIAQTRNSKVNLTVIVPPQRVVITDEAGKPLDVIVGPFGVGDSFLLRCDVYGAKPLPVVRWYKNDVLVSNTSVEVPSGGPSHVRAELRIGKLSRKDLKSILTCNATNNFKSKPVSATIAIDMNFGPLDVHILGGNQPLSAGRKYDLLCQSTGSRPPAMITWWKNGQRMDKTKETTSSDGNTTTSTLTFIASKDDAGQYLSCKAENKAVSSESLEDGWRLDIQYTPEAKIILGTSLDPDAIREGTDVYFDCVIKAYPSVYKVEWRHNGRTLSHNVGQGVIISNQSLVLQGVSRATAGNYTCVGYNTEGDGESNVFFLNVMFAPTCKPNQIRIHGVAKSEEAKIKCDVEANPPDVQFKWMFNNSAESIDVQSSHIARTGTSSIVTYIPITELDYGTLLCYASNKIGHQRIPCVFHIIAAGRPDQVHNCSVSNISMTSFSIRCSEGFNGGLPQSFLLQVRETQSQDLKANLTSPIARFSVTGLEAGAHYQAVLASFNAKGRSEPVIIPAATLRLPEKQLTAEKEHPRHGFKFTPMMSILVGVVAALLIVALVVLLVLRLQCTTNDSRKRRQKQNSGSAGSLDHGSGSDHRGSNDKIGGSPVSKHDSSGGECDSDEKNPDIIPQPVDVDEHSEIGRRRQHISTIETSPSRSLLHQPPAGYVGYCTLRNGIPPLHELSAAQQKIHAGAMIGPQGYPTCTLPRQQWQQYTQAQLAPGVYPVQYRAATLRPRPQPPPRSDAHAIPLQPLTNAQPILAQHTQNAHTQSTSEDDACAETPLMCNKRESTV